jgi:hypothetical protein
MTSMVRSTVVDAAEQAMRTHLGKCDQPLLRLEAMAIELFLAFRDAAGGQAEGTALAEVAAGFRMAFERIWTECGGDPGRIPEIELPLDGITDPTAWRGQTIQQ